MKVQPVREGLKVPIPERPNQFLPHGSDFADRWTEVGEGQYWHRSLRRGDIRRQAEKPRRAASSQSTTKRTAKSED